MFRVPGACLRQAGGAAEDFSPCGSYLPEKAGRGSQVGLFMLKIPGGLQAMMFWLPCSETGASNGERGGSSSLGCAPLPSP